jgi:hypothetical protein
MRPRSSLGLFVWKMARLRRCVHKPCGGQARRPPPAAGAWRSRLSLRRCCSAQSSLGSSSGRATRRRRPRPSSLILQSRCRSPYVNRPLPKPRPHRRPHPRRVPSPRCLRLRRLCRIRRRRRKNPRIPPSRHHLTQCQRCPPTRPRRPSLRCSTRLPRQSPQALQRRPKHSRHAPWRHTRHAARQRNRHGHGHTLWPPLRPQRPHLQRLPPRDCRRRACRPAAHGSPP